MSKLEYIEDICDILDSQRVPVTGSNRIKGEYPYYGANGVQDYVDDYIFDDELVLVAEDGGNFGSKEKPIAYRVSGKCWVNNHAHVLKAKEIVDIDYLCYALMFYDVSDIVNGATRQKLNQAALRKMQIPLPHLDEQKRIADELDKISGLVAKRKSQLEKLDLLVKAKFVEMFGDPVTNPMGWEKEPFLNLGKCKNGMNFGANESGFRVHCLGVGDFKDLSTIVDTSTLSCVSLDKLPSEDYLLKDGDIVFVRSNGNKELVGRCLVIYPGNITTTFSGFCIRYRMKTEKLNISYLLQVLKHQSIRKQMAGRGANIQNLNQQILGTLEIPLPPVALQNQFADYVTKVEQTNIKLQKGLEQLETLYKARMQNYFG